MTWKPGGGVEWSEEERGARRGGGGGGGGGCFTITEKQVGLICAAATAQALHNIHGIRLVIIVLLPYCLLSLLPPAAAYESYYCGVIF